MKRLQQGFTAIELMLVIFVLTIVPYITNIYKVVVGLSALPALADISGMLILRVIGIVFYPLGAVMGFL